MVKRSLCTLKMAEYQLMYVAEGLASGKELGELWLNLRRNSDRIDFA